MEKINYKAIDRERILSFIASQGGMASVIDIMEQSGAEKLRVYPILMEEKLAGRLMYVEEEEYGSPKVVKIVTPNRC